MAKMVEKLKELTESKIILLVWVIVGMSIILSGATAYQFIAQADLSKEVATSLSQMPDKYVRLERYQADTKRMDEAMCRLEQKFANFTSRVENKIDMLVLRGREDKP